MESTGISVCYLLHVSWSLAQLKCSQGLSGKAPQLASQSVYVSSWHEQGDSAVRNISL